MTVIAMDTETLKVLPFLRQLQLEKQIALARAKTPEEKEEILKKFQETERAIVENRSIAKAMDYVEKFQDEVLLSQLKQAVTETAQPTAQISTANQNQSTKSSGALWLLIAAGVILLIVIFGRKG